MNTLQHNFNIKTFIRKFSVKNYNIEFNFSFDKKSCNKTFFIFIEKKYQKEQEQYIRRIGYGMEHQLINNRNKITAHTRKQILKKL